MLSTCSRSSLVVLQFKIQSHPFFFRFLQVIFQFLDLFEELLETIFIFVIFFDLDFNLFISCFLTNRDIQTLNINLLLPGRNIDRNPWFNFFPSLSWNIQSLSLQDRLAVLAFDSAVLFWSHLLFNDDGLLEGQLLLWVSFAFLDDNGLAALFLGLRVLLLGQGRLQLSYFRFECCHAPLIY